MKNYNSPNIYIVAGEPSGDILGDQLIKSLESKFNSPIFNGVGGERMQSNNFISLFDMSDISIFGIFPVLRKLFFLMNKINDVVKDISQKKPDIIILIDSPDFNHRVAKKVKKYLPDVPIVCYVAPTVWAWRQGRAKKMSEYFDYLLSVIPFEVNFFEKYGLKTSYVGHPFIEKVKNINDITFSEKYDLDKSKTIIFLPGSRKIEIERHSPVMVQAIDYLKDQNLNLNILIATGQKQLDQIRDYFKDIQIITDLILGRESSKELLQDNFNKENLIDELSKLLSDEDGQKKQINDLKEFNAIMNKNIDNPSENASKIIKRLLEN